MDHRVDGRAQRKQARSSTGTRRTTTGSDKQDLVRKYPLLPKAMRIPSTTADQRSKVVADLTSADLDDTTPVAVPPSHSNTGGPKNPAEARAKDIRLKGRRTGKFVSVRRELIRPLPTVAVFSDLPDETTIADVLLSIREARVAGRISADEARVSDARLRKRRARDTSRSVTVEFTIPAGAERVHSLSQAGHFTIRGLVPRTSLNRSAGARRFPTPDGGDKTGALECLMSADPAEKRRYLDRLKVKDNLVRRTHLNYNREASLAVADEEQLKFGAVFKSIYANGDHVPTRNSEEEAGSGNE